MPVVRDRDPLAIALASPAHAALVRYFAVNPDTAPLLSSIGRATGLSSSELREALDRLRRAGLIKRIPGRQETKYLVLDDCDLWAPLRAMVRQLSDPAHVLPFALADVSGLYGAFIFGSFASGFAREESDVDLFVLGDLVDEPALSRHTIDASVLLGREVNVVQATVAEFRSRRASNRFYREVAGRPKVWLIDRAGLQAEFDGTPLPESPP